MHGCYTNCSNRIWIKSWSTTDLRTNCPVRSTGWSSKRSLARFTVPDAEAATKGHLVGRRKKKMSRSLRKYFERFLEKYELDAQGQGSAADIKGLPGWGIVDGQIVRVGADFSESEVNRGRVPKLIPGGEEPLPGVGAIGGKGISSAICQCEIDTAAAHAELPIQAKDGKENEYIDKGIIHVTPDVQDGIDGGGRNFFESQADVGREPPPHDEPGDRIRGAVDIAGKFEIDRQFQVQSGIGKNGRSQPERGQRHKKQYPVKSITLHVDHFSAKAIHQIFSPVCTVGPRDGLIENL